MSVECDRSAPGVLRLSMPVVEVVADGGGLLGVEERGVRHVAAHARGQQAMHDHVRVTGHTPHFVNNSQATEPRRYCRCTTYFLHSAITLPVATIR